MRVIPLLSIAAAVVLGATPHSASFGSASVPPANGAPEMSERASRFVAEISQSLADKDWERAERLLAEFSGVASPQSYDAATLALYQAQFRLSRGDATRGDLAAAIGPLETVVRSSYFPREQVLEWTYVLAQLYAQVGELGKADATLETWLDTAPAPTVAGYILRLSVGLELAERAPPAESQSRLGQLLERACEGLLLGARPDETLLYLRAVCLQRLERWDEAAELLELILKYNPVQRERWEQLLAMYVNAGRGLTAVLTIDRARESNLLGSPQTDLLRGQLLHGLGQDRLALDALETGLRRGVDDPAPHWILAAYVAYTLDELERADRLLQQTTPLSLAEGQRHLVASLEEAIAIRTAER